MCWKFLLLTFVAVSARNIKRGAEYYEETIYLRGNARQIDPYVAYVEPNREVRNFESHRRVSTNVPQQQKTRVIDENINPQYETFDQSQQSFGRVEPRHIHSQNYQNNVRRNNDFQHFGEHEESYRVKVEDKERDSRVQINENNKRIDETNQRINQQVHQNSRKLNENQPNNERFDNKQQTDKSDARIINQGQEYTRRDEIHVHNQNNDRQHTKEQDNRYSADRLSSQNNENSHHGDNTQTSNRKSIDNHEDTVYYDNQKRTNVNTNSNQNRHTNTYQDPNNRGYNINEPAINQENMYNNEKRTNKEILKNNPEHTNINRNPERTHNDRDSENINREIINSNRDKNGDRERTYHNTGNTLNKPKGNNNNDRTNYNAERTNHNSGKTNHNIGRTGDEFPNGSNQAPEDKWNWGAETTPPAVTVDYAITPNLDDRAAFNGGGCPVGKVKVKDTCVEKD